MTVSVAPTIVRAMGTIVSLEAYRRRRRPAPNILERLELAVGRLDPLVSGRGGRLTPTIERELQAIAHAVGSGEAREAADRAERLVGLLQHPAANG